MRYSNYYSSSGLYHISLPCLMGTRLDALLFGKDDKYLEKVWSEAEAALFCLEKKITRFGAESEVSKINHEAQFTAVQLSEELWNIFRDCERYYENTGHYFDITLSDFGKIIIMEESRSILFNEYGLSLDFGGYAKGYALRYLQQHFAEAGITRALVNFGNSSVLALGTHPYGNHWSIGVENPFNGEQLTTIELCDTALSVSGNTPLKPQHIVSPRAGRVAENPKMAVVVSDNPLDAEVLTTAWIASQEQQEPQWMKKFDLKQKYILTC